MYILVPKKHQGKKIPTELQLEKAKVLCCFRLAKQWLQYFGLFNYIYLY